MERIDDLQVNGLKLIQNPDGFCFGSDSVELANFVTGSTRDTAVDLGAGNGIISVLLAGKKGICVTAVEIDRTAADLCARNVVLNNLQSLIKVINAPMQEVMLHGTTVVVCNPPYFKQGSGAMRTGISGTRHELHVTCKEVVCTASRLLSTGGRFFVCYPVDRMAELFAHCRTQKLEPKEAVLLHSGDKPPHLFLLKCVKDAGTGFKVTVRKIKNYGME